MSKIFASRIRIVYVGYVMKKGYILLSIISERWTTDVSNKIIMF